VHRGIRSNGEISADCDVETLALISPSMAAYRVLILRKPVDRAFLLSLIDGALVMTTSRPWQS
jgi:hypothetical protein